MAEPDVAQQIGRRARHSDWLEWAVRIGLLAYGLTTTGTDTTLDDASIAEYFLGEVLAAQSPEVRDFLFEDPTWPVVRRAAMRTWLMNGEIDLDGHTYRPLDILSDTALTKRALAELHAAT